MRDINARNVAHLGLAWIAEMDDPMGLAAEPIVVDGIIYLSAPRSIVRAIDAATGRILWTFDPHVRVDFSIGNSSVARVNRGVAVWEGKVFVGTGDGRLVAIDAGNGTQLWSSSVIDPKLDGISGAPRVAAGKVFIGCSGSDEQVRGSIAAFDAVTGKELWRFWTVPGDPALGFENNTVAMAAKTWTGDEWWRQGGGSVWDPITYDAKTGLLIFGTSKAFRLWSPSTMMVTPTSKYGPSRLLAFKLGGRQPFPLPALRIPQVPRPPEQTFSAEQIKRGEALADSHSCTDCHSPQFDGAGRWVLNGGVPDLRYMPAEAHREWAACNAAAK